jgi:23S rRNA pseudouridine1911/1915/1917 synthase
MTRPAILFETPHLLAVNKPAGLLVERSLHGYASVEDWAAQYLGQAVRRPFVGIVHRLDRPVSGVLLLARKPSTLKQLNEQFRLRQVRKTYLAIVESAPPQAAGELLHWLLKDQKNKRAEVVAPQHKSAFECQLRYRLLAESAARYLLEVEPFTGKFHQIRVQLAAAGCPILGDVKYGGHAIEQQDAIALHAWKLEFSLPPSGEKTETTAPPPAEKIWSAFKI